MRHNPGVRTTIVLLGAAALLGMAGAAAAQHSRVSAPRFHAVVNGATRTPSAGVSWRYVVRAADSSGRPVQGTAVLRVFVGGQALDTVGLGEYFAAPDGVCVVEWPEHLGAYGEDEHVLVTIGAVSETKRRLTFTPRGDRYADLLGELKAEAFGVER